MGIFQALKNLLTKKREPEWIISSDSSDRNSASNSSPGIEIGKTSKDALETASDSHNKPGDHYGKRPQNSAKGISMNYIPTPAYRFEKGRRYHAAEMVSYMLPNDEHETNRIGLQHWLLRHVFQQNFQAPVAQQLQEGIKVLDSGCGPAVWTYEMGEAFDQSQFYAVDISLVCPEKFRPPNVQFVEANVAKRMPFQDNTFGYVHQRLLFLGLTAEDWVSNLEEMYRVLKPGGYIELSEPDFVRCMSAGPTFKKVHKTLTNEMKARGFVPFLVPELVNRLLTAGFEEPFTKTADIPMNHSGLIGEVMWEDYSQVYKTLHSLMSVSNPEWKDLDAYLEVLKKCGEEAKQSQTCIEWNCVYARKPLDSEVKFL